MNSSPWRCTRVTTTWCCAKIERPASGLPKTAGFGADPQGDDGDAEQHDSRSKPVEDQPELAPELEDTVPPGPGYPEKDNHEGASPERKTGETKP
ncbi:MAG: hypothetical protein LBK99_26300 [Opitutaceae bacterium]|nr:hypothetical protein [Opitutaceae bacterium]